MSSFSQEDPRANQKARTREAIVEAARQLHQQGITPTVAQAAEQARVSRATAYRYFPTQEALNIEVTDVTPKLVEVEKLVGSLTTEDVERRLLLLLDTFGPIVLAEEGQFRTDRGYTTTPGYGATATVVTTTPLLFARAAGCGGSTKFLSRLTISPRSRSSASEPLSPSPWAQTRSPS